MTQVVAPSLSLTDHDPGITVLGATATQNIVGGGIALGSVLPQGTVAYYEALLAPAPPQGLQVGILRADQPTLLSLSSRPPYVSYYYRVGGALGTTGIEQLVTSVPGGTVATLGVLVDQVAGLIAFYLEGKPLGVPVALPPGTWRIAMSSGATSGPPWNSVTFNFGEHPFTFDPRPAPPLAISASSVPVVPALVMVERYLDLVTSEHASQPNFTTTLATALQPFVDTLNLLQELPAAYDVDIATGAQLDAVGLWVGQSRQLPVPLSGVYFAFNTPGVGFNQGSWQGPYDPSTGLEQLPDDAYRTVLKARIASNHWDGTVPGAVAIWDALFADQGVHVVIEDHGDMTMSLYIVGTASLDAVTQGLLAAGYLNLKPCGVRISSYAGTPPFFGFNLTNASIAGFNSGKWMP